MQILDITWTIRKYLSDQERIHHPKWIRENISSVLK